MKSRTDVLCGLALLGLCGLGAYSAADLPRPMAQDVVGPASFPIAILLLLSVCSLLLLVRGAVLSGGRSLWPERAVLIRIILFLLVFFAYLALLVIGGDWLASMERPPVESGGAFALSTAAFLLIALPLMGRRRAVEVALVAVGVTAVQVVVFGHFFQVLLP